jgi:hypothetical protein
MKNICDDKFNPVNNHIWELYERIALLEHKNAVISEQLEKVNSKTTPNDNMNKILLNCHHIDELKQKEEEILKLKHIIQYLESKLKASECDNKTASPINFDILIKKLVKSESEKILYKSKLKEELANVDNLNVQINNFEKLVNEQKIIIKQLNVENDRFKDDLLNNSVKCKISETLLKTDISLADTRRSTFLDIDENYVDELKSLITLLRKEKDYLYHENLGLELRLKTIAKEFYDFKILINCKDKENDFAIISYID